MKPLFRGLILLAALWMCGGLVGCDDHISSTSNVNAAEDKPQTGLSEIKLEIGKKTFTLEVADTDKSREIGLMFRDSMPADHGMIFVFPREDIRNFWMKNTRIALDILYLAEDGRVVSIHRMLPFDLRGAQSDGPAQYAIELNAGAAADAGIKAGDKIKLPQLKSR